MRRLRLSTLLVPLIALLVMVVLAPRAAAQATKKVTGTVTTISADSVTVKVGTTDMNFSVDDKIKVIAPGAGTRSRQAAQAGKKPTLGELLKSGDPVEVSYTESGAARHATELRKVSSAGTAGVPSNAAEGTVTAVTADSLSITGSAGGGSTFNQTYVIGPDTKVVGKGAGTAANKAGGRVAITDLVGNGDRVSVTFKPEGDKLHAAEVRVTMKATPKKSS